MQRQMSSSPKIIINCDGGARGNPGPAASAFVVSDDNGNVIHEEGRFLGVATNNVAEYSAVVDALTWAVTLQNSKIRELSVVLDSELVARQMKGEYKIKSSLLVPLAVKVKSLEKTLPFTVSYSHVSRQLNTLADKRVNEILDAIR